MTNSVSPPERDREGPLAGGRPKEQTSVGGSGGAAAASAMRADQSGRVPPLVGVSVVGPALANSTKIPGVSTSALEESQLTGGGGAIEVAPVAYPAHEWQDTDEEEDENALAVDSRDDLVSVASSSLSPDDPLVAMNDPLDLFVALETFDPQAARLTPDPVFHF